MFIPDVTYSAINRIYHWVLQRSVMAKPPAYERISTLRTRQSNLAVRLGTPTRQSDSAVQLGFNLDHPLPDAHRPSFWPWRLQSWTKIILRVSPEWAANESNYRIAWCLRGNNLVPYLKHFWRSLSGCVTGSGVSSRESSRVWRRSSECAF